MPAPFEARNRAAKAVAIADFLWNRLTPEERSDDGTADRVWAYSAEERLCAAEDAGQRDPSDQTWALVVQRLRYRVRAEREGPVSAIEAMRRATHAARRSHVA